MERTSNDELTAAASDLTYHPVGQAHDRGLQGTSPTDLIQPERVTRSALYALLLFLMINIVLSIDRSVLSVVMEPIKHEFKLSDGQLGLLTLGFAVFFGVAGLPLGRWVDRGRRGLILAVCVGVFSLMTGAAGLARNFGQLLATRVIVGAGEAGGGPAMLSMLSDLFPARRRASAISVYYLAPPIAFLATFLAGSWVAQTFGWRNVFFLASAPGVLLAVVVLLGFKEPARGCRSPTLGVPWLQSLRFILSQRAQRHVLATTMLTSALSAAVISWSISFMIRSHGLSLARAGMVLAIAYGLVGAVGSVAGGWLVDRLAKRDVRWRAWTCAAAVTLAFPALDLFLISPGLVSACFGLCVWSMATSSLYGPAVAMSQSLAPPRMRGLSAATFYLLSNLVGVGLGPLFIGMISDGLRSEHGPDSLRFALLYLSAIYLWAALHFLLAARTLRVDLVRAEVEAEERPK